MTKLEKLMEAYTGVKKNTQHKNKDVVEGIGADLEHYKTSTGKTIRLRRPKVAGSAVTTGAVGGLAGAVIGRGPGAAIGAGVGALYGGLRARHINKEHMPYMDEIIKKTNAKPISKDEYKKIRIEHMGKSAEKWNKKKV